MSERPPSVHIRRNKKPPAQFPGHAAPDLSLTPAKPKRQPLALSWHRRQKNRSPSFRSERLLISL